MMVCCHPHQQGQKNRACYAVLHVLRNALWQGCPAAAAAAATPPVPACDLAAPAYGLAAAAAAGVVSVAGV
jgi:hypothetical protein